MSYRKGDFVRFNAGDYAGKTGVAYRDEWPSGMLEVAMPTWTRAGMSLTLTVVRDLTQVRRARAWASDLILARERVLAA